MKRMKVVQFPETVEMNEMKPEDYNKLVPRSLENSSNEAYVANRFGDQALQNLLQSPMVKNSPMGKTALKVEGAMKTEVSLNGGSSSAKGKNGSVKPAVDHRLSFQVMALQGTTKMEYKGWTNATLKHGGSETGIGRHQSREGNTDESAGDSVGRLLARLRSQGLPARQSAY